MSKAKKSGWLKIGKSKVWGIVGGDWKKAKRFAKQHAKGLKKI